MPTYQYRAMRIADQNKIQGTINAETERQARELLREQELYPTEVKPLISKSEEGHKNKKEPSAIELWLADKLATVGTQERITFTQNLQMMVKAGIPITEALLYMESYMDNLKFRKLLNSIRRDILSGASFSNSLSNYPKVFSDVYISIVHAGEVSGELEAVLHRLSDMLSAEAKLRKKVISAMVYPCMVIFIAVLVFLVMMVFVLPVFSDMYSKMGITLPLITQIMLGISHFLRSYWYIVILSVVGVVLGYKKYVSTPQGKTNVDAFTLKIPVISPLIVAVSVSHFISTLNVSFSAGLPITDCIFMACQTVTHNVIRQAFDEVNLKIQAGQRLASALADTEILPSMLVIMISTGEESGALEVMLAHCLDYLETEVNQRIDVLMSMMEPLLLIVLGVMVGCLAMSVYLPLYSMYEHIH